MFVEVLVSVYPQLTVARAVRRLYNFLLVAALSHVLRIKRGRVDIPYPTRLIRPSGSRLISDKVCVIQLSGKYSEISI